MKSEIMDYLKQKTKFWWLSLIAGLVAIIFAICCMIAPDILLVPFIYMFVIGYIISGIVDTVFAITNRKSISGWGWVLAGGIFDLLLGILLIVQPIPVLSAVSIYFISFWILFRSIWMIGVALELNYFINASGLLIFGIFALILSISCLFFPTFGKIIIIALASTAFLCYGIFRIYYAFQLKKLNGQIKKIDK